jgi:hypothetical protein
VSVSPNFVEILRYIRPVTLAATIVLWLVVLEPLFKAVPPLDSFDKFVGGLGKWLPLLLHFCAAYLLVRAAEAGVELIKSHLKQHRDKKHAKAAAEQRFEAKAKVFRTASPEEKLVLRVFVDSGYQRVGNHFFGDTLKPLAIEAGFEEAAMRKAVSRLAERDIVHHSDADYFQTEAEYYLRGDTFAFLSEHPELVGSTAPRRYVNTP